jgi:hypothetical protein
VLASPASRILDEKVAAGSSGLDGVQPITNEKMGQISQR